MNSPITPIVSGRIDLDTFTSTRTTDGQSGFTKTLQDAMDEAGKLQTTAEKEIQGILNGQGKDLHTAMIAVEKADLSFQLMMQVRNKIVAAYQEVSRLQF
jgi:flagellar hook-basal body complex protein FliE